MHTPPATSYARSGDVHIAYQVAGGGPLDLVFVMGWVSNLDYFWTEPHFAHFLNRLASFSRLIVFDKRGTGLSDRAVGMPTLEERADDVRAIMDAAGSRKAALLGVSEGAVLAALFAASHPDRVSALVIVGGYARRLWAPDYTFGLAVEERLGFIDRIEHNWGTDDQLPVRAPSLVDDDRFREWWRTYLRMSASPGAAAALTRMNMQIDIREILSTIRVPTLIIHRSGDKTVLADNGRYLAEHIPAARYIELPGDDHLPFAGDQEEILREIEHFLTGHLPVPEPDRVLATLMFAGIASAAATAVRIGDQAWSEMTAAFAAIRREQVARFGGREAPGVMGGQLATFDGPARGIRCAAAIVESARSRGIAARAALHAGECEHGEDELRGVAVQIAERVFDRANVGDVLVSGTVKDLVVGSGIEFEDLETRLLTGPATGWRLHRVAGSERPVRSTGSARLAEPEVGRPPGVLSPREREIAVLVAHGQSNREVAGTLSISPATVERHVANILGKLGFRSRAQIAAWAVAHDLLPAASQ